MNVSGWHMVCDGIEKLLSEELHGKLGVVVERIPRTQPRRSCKMHECLGVIFSVFACDCRAVGHSLLDPDEEIARLDDGAILLMTLVYYPLLLARWVKLAHAGRYTTSREPVACSHR